MVGRMSAVVAHVYIVTQYCYWNSKRLQDKRILLMFYFGSGYRGVYTWHHTCYVQYNSTQHLSFEL